MWWNSCLRAIGSQHVPSGVSLNWSQKKMSRQYCTNTQGTMWPNSYSWRDSIPKRRYGWTNSIPTFYLGNTIKPHQKSAMAANTSKATSLIKIDDADALGQRLEKEIPGFQSPVKLVQFKTGQSNPTYMITDARRVRYYLLYCVVLSMLLLWPKSWRRLLEVLNVRTEKRHSKM